MEFFIQGDDGKLSATVNYHGYNFFNTHNFNPKVPKDWAWVFILKLGKVFHYYPNFIVSTYSFND